MIEIKRKIRKAGYLEHFKCIGGTCEDNCCIGWSVEIDKQTFAKYKKLKDPPLAELIKETIYLNEDSYNDKVDYALVELKENKHCPFLNECRLCRIQAKFGEDYLSNVCATYPRLSNEINGVLEHSATISCPEVARLILGCREGILFVETEEKENTRKIISLSVDTGSSETPVIKYLIELRDFTMKILQSRQFLLWERILFLGFFFEEVEKDNQIHKGANIKKIIASFEKDFKNEKGQKKLTFTKIDEQRQLKILKEISDQLNNSEEVDSREYLDFIQEFLSGIGAENESNPETGGKKYKQAYHDYYQPFMKDKEYMLENYMVNYVFQSLFPAGESTNPFEAYQKLAIRYSLVKFYLIGIGGHRGKLEEKTVTEFIQVFSKALEHNYLYFEKVFDYLQKNNFNTMDYMAILVRN